MQYAPLGISYKTKSLLSDPISENDFADIITGVKEKMIQQAKGMGFRDSSKYLKQKSENPFKKEDGWTYVISEYQEEPDKEKIIQAMKPLAKLRSMAIPSKPDVFFGKNTTEMDWLKWISEFKRISTRTRPKYILLVGNPELIPFGFQAALDLEANVGRIDFEDIKDLEKYVKKIEDFYKTPPPLKKEALFFATNHGIINNKRDPTHYSFNHMIIPLLDYCKSQQIKTYEILEKEASKNNLINSLQQSNAIVAYAACHGIGEVLDSNEQDLTGAICCQDYLKSKDDEKDLFRSVDIPQDKPFIPGGVFFQFSCYSYGTPKYNSIAKYSFGESQQRKQLASKDFVASIPKKLLANPKGPIAFIGHVDAAWLEGFYNIGKQDVNEIEKREIDVYQSLISSLYNKQTLGAAMYDMNMKHAQSASAFTNIMLRYQHEKGSGESKQQLETTAKDLNRTFIQSNDSENFMLFGDPALSFFHVPGL